MGQIVDRAKLAIGAALNERVSNRWINFSRKAPVYTGWTGIYAMEGFILLPLSIRQRNIIPG